MRVFISASRPQRASYSYDQADQLISAAVAGTGVVGYAYNGDGPLAATYASAGVATNTWDDTSRVGLLLSDRTNDHIYGPNGTPLEQAELSSGMLDYYIPDAQGSTRALLDSTGAVAATLSYDAYGNLMSSSGAGSTPLLYDGQYLDPTTGFYYLRARWYDPATTQFTSVDPAWHRRGSRSCMPATTRSIVGTRAVRQNLSPMKPWPIAWHYGPPAARA